MADLFGIGQVLGAAVGGALNIGNTAVAAKFAKEGAEEERKFQEEMWNKSNEYNSPAAQMARMKQAGLNANLMYGSISPGNTQPMKVEDPSGKKAIANAIAKMDYMQMGIAVARAREELKALKLANQYQETKNYKAVIDSDHAFTKYRLDAARLAGFEAWANEHGYHVNEAGTSYTRPDGTSVPFAGGFGNNAAFIPYMLEFDQKLKNIQSKTNNTNAIIEINNLRKETQGLINDFKRTQNKWQPWLYGIDAGSKVVNSITGAIKPWATPKLSRPPMRYNNPYSR